MRKANINFNISFDRAMRENLLGVLAGDMAYKIGAGDGYHLRFQKEKLLSVEEREEENSETWETRITEVIVTDYRGNPVADVPADVQALLTTWDLESSEDHQHDHIWSRHTATNEGMQFAHTALVRLLDWQLPDGQKMSWRREGRRDKLNTINNFRSALMAALDLKIVQHVLDVHPRSKPQFLP